MMRQRCSALALAAALALLFLTACSGDPTGPNPGSISGDSHPISFQAPTLVVALGEAVNLNSLLDFNPSSPLDQPVECVWNSSDEGTAFVSPTGAMKALGLGTAVITVQFQGYSTGITIEVVEDHEIDPPIIENGGG